MPVIFNIYFCLSPPSLACLTRQLTGQGPARGWSFPPILDQPIRMLLLTSRLPAISSIFLPLFPSLQSPQVKGPFPARRFHFKILTLLALSPTYSYDLEKLRMELAWDEQSYGNLQQYLSNVRHEGKQLYTLVTTEHGWLLLIK